MKKSLRLIFSAFLLLALCFDASAKSKKNKKNEEEPAINMTFPEPAKNLYKGENLTIAVNLPTLSNSAQSDNWIPQYFQDSLTGKIAQFSKMRVVDRKNEALMKEAQERSESGYYSEENAIQIGQMTNAQLEVAGNIQKISETYEANFRVVDATTAEIKASSNNRYSLSDMQSGKAVNEVAQNLLEGLGIELSETEKAELAKVNEVENKSTVNLAKGTVAEESQDYISALEAYSQIEGNLKPEAETNIHIMLAGKVDTLSLQERIAFYNAQKEKWNKIFAQLEAYMNENAHFIVYDFSNVIDKINMQKNTVDLQVQPGVKCVPNSLAMKVWAIVLNEWKVLISDKNNDIWTKSVSKPVFGEAFYGNRISAERWVPYSLRYVFNVSVGLFDNEGYLIKKFEVKVDSNEGFIARDGGFIVDEILTKPQRKYFSDAENHTVYFENVSMKDISNGLNVKFIDAKTEVFSKNGHVYKRPAAVFSVEEWNKL